MDQIISTPRFGGCRDPITGEISKCVLKPSDCSSSLNYVKPNEVERNKCSSISQVEVGRCSSGIDNQICAPSPESCSIEAKYIEDATCNAIQDTTDSSQDATTGYPYCNYDNSNRRCVISSSHCESGETFFYIKEFEYVEPCPCHNVPTGLCYIATMPVTADSSFCAVSAYDCPLGYTWLSAHGLLDLSQAPRTCRLCPQFSIVPKQPMHEQVVTSGGCFKGPDLIQRALESTDCPPGSEFSSSQDLRQDLGIVPLFVDDLSTGRCTSGIDKVKCTGNKSGCQIQVKFVQEDSCTVHSETATGKATLYGQCRESVPEGGNWRNHRCVWHESECDSPFEIYWYARLPDPSHIDECSCENVETGGCSYLDGSETKYYCAVSSQGCSDPSQYKSTLQLRDLGESCHLCQPQRDQGSPTSFPITVGHGAIVSAPAPTFTTIPTILPPAFQRSDNRRATKRITIGISLGGLAVILFIVLLLVRLSGRNRPIGQREEAQVASAEKQEENDKVIDPAIIPYPEDEVDKTNELL